MSSAVVKINGRDISENAFFGSSQRIGSTSKENIKKILCERKSNALLGKLLCLPPGVATPKLIQSKSIEDSNLVARYCSMPKKGFLFLAQGLKHDPECHPFIRVREAYEIQDRLKT